MTTPRKSAVSAPDQIYVYCGDGLGVPGLPHRVTREAAEQRGHLADLDAAIERGDYRPEKPAQAGKEE